MSTKLYERIGLSPDEIAVYSIIVSKFVRTSEELEILSDKKMTADTIQNSLSSLEKKKFIRVIPGKIPQYIALSPPIAVTSGIDKQIDKEMNKIRENILKKWEDSKQILNSLINEYQHGQEIFTKSKAEFNQQISKLDDKIRAKSTDAKEKLNEDFTKLNQENKAQFDILISSYSKNLEKEVQQSISNLETALKDIKNNQETERNTNLEEVVSIYNTAVEGLNNVFSQFMLSIQNIRTHLTNAYENLDSSLITINKHTKSVIDQNQTNVKTDLDSISAEIGKKIADKLTIFSQQINTIQNNLIQTGDESFTTINEIISNINQQTSKSSSSIKELTLETAENLFHNFNETIESLNNRFNTLKTIEKHSDFKNALLSVSEVTAEIKSNLDDTINNLDEGYKEGLKRINSDIINQISSFQAKLTEDTNSILNNLNKNIESKYDDSIEQTKALSREISTLLEANSGILSQETTTAIENAVNNHRQKNDELLVLINENFTKIIHNIAETEKTITEDSELNLVDTITAFDKLNLEIKEIQTEGKNSLLKNITYLKNVSNEEFSSFDASANMMLGQMQSTLTENVSERTAEIAQSFTVFNKISERINQISLIAQNEISSFISELRSSFDESIKKITEVFNQDKEDIGTIIENVTNNAKEEQDIQIKESEKKLTSFSDEIEKVSLELSQNIPTQLEEYQAQHTDDFNNFDRAVKAELNKVKSRLTEIDKEVTERLSKRVSLGKGGFQDIGKIVKAALTEFEVAQKRTEKLIDGQINNYEETSSNLSEAINNTLNKENLAIQRILNSFGDTLSQSVKNSYDLALKKNVEFSEIVETKISSKRELLIGQFGIIFSNLSGSISENLTKALVEEFEKVNVTLKDLNQTIGAPAEIERLFITELENFIQNLQLAFQTASETGASRILEIINESLLTEINGIFDNLSSKDLNNLKETVISNWKSSSHSSSSLLSQINNEFSEQSNEIQEIARGKIQEVLSNLEETKNQIDTLFTTKMQTLDTNQLEKHATLPSSLDEKKKEISSIIIDAQSALKQTYDEMLKTTTTSLNEITSDISSNTEDRLKEIKNTPQNVERSLNEIIALMENQMKEIETAIEEIRSSNLENLGNTKEKMATRQSSFIKRIEEINNTVENEINGIKDRIANISNVFQDKKGEIEKDFQQATKTLDTDVKVSISSLEEEIETGKIQISQKIDRAYQEFQTTNENFSSSSKSYIDSLKNRYEGLIEELINFLQDETSKANLEREKNKTTELYQEFHNRLDQGLSSFSSTFGGLIANHVENISKDVQSSLSNITSLIIKAANSNKELFEDLGTEILLSYESESKKTSTSLEHEISDLFDKINDKSMKSQDTITSDLSQLINSIPKQLENSLTKSKELMASISEIQQIAADIQIDEIETTYLQRQPESEVIQTLEAILSRTKSTIQIIVPKLSMISMDMLKQAGTRRRIQIFTQVDNKSQAAQIKADFGNVQLKHYDGVEVFAFARDGDEEAAIGSAKDDTIHLIMTTDGNLIGVLKEIIQGLWPRGKLV